MQTLDVSPFGPAYRANVLRQIYVEPGAFSKMLIEAGIDCKVNSNGRHLGICHITKISPVFMDEEGSLCNEARSGYNFMGNSGTTLIRDGLPYSWRGAFWDRCKSAARMIKIEFMPTVIIIPEKQVDALDAR